MAQDEISIINPYFSVDWTSYGQFKANFHSHSVESDGGNQPAEMFEDHYAKDFEIMTLTDHNFTNTTWDRTDRPANIFYLTSGRMTEINAGTDRGGRGMIGIPFIATLEVYLDNAAIEPHSILMLESMAFGEHQLVLVATDNAGNETMKELKFVIDASIDTLVWLLENYYEDGYITNHGIFNSLKKKVEKGHLNAFINQLHAKDGKKHIDSEQLMILLEYAEYLK